MAELYDDGDELHAEWLLREKAFRVETWRKQMPKAMRTAGELHVDVAAWTAGLVHDRSAANLLLVGPVGTGKTWSCWHAVEVALQAGWRGGPSLYSAYEWRQLSNPPVDEVALRDATRSDLLILDDPGAMRLGAWELEHLYGVIDYRWNHHLPTVITSNVPDLRAMLGERIASRLASNAVVVVLDGTDRRREGQ